MRELFRKASVSNAVEVFLDGAVEKAGNCGAGALLTAKLLSVHGIQLLQVVRGWIDEELRRPVQQVLLLRGLGIRRFDASAELFDPLRLGPDDFVGGKPRRDETVDLLGKAAALLFAEDRFQFFHGIDPGPAVLVVRVPRQNAVDPALSHETLQGGAAVFPLFLLRYHVLVNLVNRLAQEHEDPGSSLRGGIPAAELLVDGLALVLRQHRLQAGIELFHRDAEAAPVGEDPRQGFDGVLLIGGFADGGLKAAEAKLFPGLLVQGPVKILPPLLLRQVGKGSGKQLVRLLVQMLQLDPFPEKFLARGRVFVKGLAGLIFVIFDRLLSLSQGLHQFSHGMFLLTIFDVTSDILLCALQL